MTVSSLLPFSRGYYLAILELKVFLNMLYLWYAVNLPSLKGFFVVVFLSGFPSTLNL